MSKTLMSAIDVAGRAGIRPLRAVAYLRVSTEEQAKGYGIGYTKKKVLAYFKKKGHEHVATFADEGLSGSLEAHDRPELKKLMEQARQTPRPFDLVGVNEGRAIGRTGRAFWRWVWELEDLGIYVAVASKDYDNSTPAGRSQMRKDADYAEEERELIRTRTQGGIQEKAEEGLYVGGNVPFGWRVKDGKFKVAKKEAAFRHWARERFLVLRSWEKVAAEANLDRNLTRSGRPWTRKNLKRMMLSEASLRNRILWRSKGARNPDGSTMHGREAVIKLPKVFSKKEAQELLDAQKVGRTPSRGRAYLLSRSLVSPCGSVYAGHNHRPGVYSYQCEGRREAYPGAGAEKCTCPQLDVDAVESAVWSDIVSLLGDAERMKSMAREWLDATSSEHVDHVGRVAQLDQQIAEASQVIDITMGVAARQAAKRGLSGREAEAAVEAAIKPLEEELAGLERMRSEALGWQREADQATRRAADFERLAEAARANLADLTPELKAELVSLLEVQTRVVRAVPRQQGVPCQIVQWFKDHQRDVPNLTDATWALVEPLLRPKRSDALPARPKLEAILLKARTGCRYEDLPEAYGAFRTIRTQAQRWMGSGVWDQIMERLEGVPGQPVWHPETTQIEVTLKPLAIESSMGDAEGDRSSTGLPRRTRCGRRSPGGSGPAAGCGPARRSP
ncbi:recombinase family protein [Streptomyces sp. NPDC057235]|uniref:recombinase family protein n=1 Tax=Streptomyces sp. NPDC057235 TaxID=3346058 RepID=UPI00363E3A7F